MEKKEILNNLLSQINAFDSKASILVTAVGVVFALVSSFLLDTNLSIWQNELAIEVTYKILFLIFLLIAFTVMFCMVMVILPRRRKDDGKLYPNYYLDITKIENHSKYRLILKDNFYFEFEDKELYTVITKLIK